MSRARIGRFKRRKVAVYGISRDTLKSHEIFEAKFGFPFDLIAGPNEKICNLFGVMQNKNMYGKKVRGIERSTFLLDAHGVLCRQWRKVKNDGHVDRVLEAAESL